MFVQYFRKYFTFPFDSPKLHSRRCVGIMRRNFFEELRVQVNSNRQGNSNLSLVDTVSTFALNLRLSNVETLVSMYNLSLDFISRFFRRNGLLRFMKNIFCTPRAKGILCLCYVRSRVETVPDHICLTAIIHVTYVRTFATLEFRNCVMGRFCPRSDYAPTATTVSAFISLVTTYGLVQCSLRKLKFQLKLFLNGF